MLTWSYLSYFETYLTDSAYSMGIARCSFRFQDSPKSIVLKILFCDVKNSKEKALYSYSVIAYHSPHFLSIHLFSIKESCYVMKNILNYVNVPKIFFFNLDHII